MYKEKYLKYKTKYLELKNQVGGTIVEAWNNYTEEIKKYLKNYNDIVNKLDKLKIDSKLYKKDNELEKIKKEKEIELELKKISEEFEKDKIGKQLIEPGELINKKYTEFIEIKKSSPSAQPSAQPIDEQINIVFQKYKENLMLFSSMTPYTNNEEKNIRDKKLELLNKLFPNLNTNYKNWKIQLLPVLDENHIAWKELKTLQSSQKLEGTIDTKIDAVNIEYKQYRVIHDLLKYINDTSKSLRNYTKHIINQKELNDIITEMNQKSEELKKLIESREYELINSPISKSSTLSSEQQLPPIDIDKQIRKRGIIINIVKKLLNLQVKNSNK